MNDNKIALTPDAAFIEAEKNLKGGNSVEAEKYVVRYLNWNQATRAQITCLAD